MSFKAWKITVLLGVGVVALPWGLSQAEDQKDSPHTVVDIMNATMKKGQWKKLANGEASPADAEKLVKLFEKLHLIKAPHGDAKSWNEKTTELWEAAQAAAKGEPGATDRLKSAANCRMCHQAHKG
ncbi:MAG: hypothetical protein JWN70_408 [Planctomycetaceae bacterium]|nr:hypothetical protein [Planctomycetaceae bacterium]